MLAELIERHHIGKIVHIEHDGFTGRVIGHYVTEEGKEGVGLQQQGTRVVHVYGVKWLKDELAILRAKEDSA